MKIVRQLLGQIISAFALFAVLFYCLLCLVVAFTPAAERGKLPPDLFEFILESSNTTWGILGFILLLFGARALAEGKKEKILFLRPFNSSANEIMMTSVARRIGDKFTFIALDDGAIPAPRFAFWEFLTGVIFFLPSGLLLLILGIVNLPTALPNWETIAPGNTVEISAALTETVLQILVICLALLMIRKSFRLIVSSSNKINIGSERDLGKAITAVERLAGWSPRFFSPRSLIFSSSDELWQSAVASFARQCWVVIIDVSAFTKNIEWELEWLNREKPQDFMVTATHDAMLPDDAMIRGKPIIRYDSNSESHSDFVRSLQQALSARL